MDIVRTSKSKWLIDFHGYTENQVRSIYPVLYQHLYNTVRPIRLQNRESSRRDQWWLFARSNEKLREAKKSLKRFIATPDTSKYKPFVFIDADTLPDAQVYCICSDDAFILGILESASHQLWLKFTAPTLEDRPRWKPAAVWNPFPFPAPTEAQKTKIRDLAEQLDAHRKRQQAAHPELTLTNMYNVLEKLRLGETLNDKEKITHQQGLITILQELHDDLDRAVFAAYGWDDLATQLVGKAGATTPLPDKPEEQAQAEEELLSRLVALNAERAAEEAQGQIRWLRPDFQAPQTQTTQQTELAVETEDTEAVTVEPASKLAWPKELPEQFKLVRSLFTTPKTLDELAKQFKTKPKALEEVVQTLHAIGNLQLEQDRYRLI
jgi:hypothetical protein